MPYSYSYSESSDESVRTPPSRDRDNGYGIPRRCKCGGRIMMETSFQETTRGRRYYVCENANEEGFRVHTRKWWDVAIDEEVHDIQMEILSVKDSIMAMKKNDDGQEIDPQMMWNNVFYSRSLLGKLEFTTIPELKKSIEDLEEETAEIAGMSDKIKEMEEKQKELTDLIHRIEGAGTTATGMKEWTELFAVFVVMVAFVIYLFK